MEREECYKNSIEKCMNYFQVGSEGLTNSQVLSRLEESKKYAIKSEKKPSFFARFWAQIKELMVLVLLVSGIVSIIIGIVEHSTGEIVDGAIILGIVVMNAIFGIFQERKSEKAIENLKKMTRPETIVLRDGKCEKIKTCDLVFGDIVCLSAGSIVPADLRLVESQNLKVKESALTGESEAVEKNAEIVYNDDKQIFDRKNCVFQSSVVECGHGKGIVEKLGTETEIGKIAESLKEEKKSLTPLQKNIKDIGKILTYIILLIAGITFVLEIIANPNEILKAFLTAVAISVAAIPESLPAVITIIMSLGIGKLSKQKAIVKKMHAVETLGACDVICSDKTGTITQNKMSVEKSFVFFDKDSEFFNQMLLCMQLCNNVEIGQNGYMGSATELAIANFADKFGYKKENLEKKYKRIAEEPFSSQRKMMSTLNVCENEKVCFCKGAIDRVLNKCKFFASESGILPLDDKTKRIIFSENEKMCNDALRVVCLAYKKTNLSKIEEDEFVFLGLCGLQDPPRPEIFAAVKKCKNAGMKTIMITGDYRKTAFAIAKKVGIAKSENEVISGEELDFLSEKEFEEIVKKKTVFARVSPTHKVKIVKALKNCGHIVAMTGDGVNDAPSMKKADIGIGMGKSGTDVTKDVADIVVSDDNFATIVVAVEEGRKIYSNIQKTIKYLFSANMAEILALFFITILLPGATFLLPVQILFVNLITDSLPAIALGTEKVEEKIMYEKPRDKNSTLLSNGAGVSILVLGGLQTVLTMIAYLYGYLLFDSQTAITMAFYTLNLIQLFFMFTARTKESIFRSNPFKNKFFNLSLIVGFSMLAAMAFTKFGELLKLTTLNFECFAIVMTLSLSIIIFGEIYKFVENKYYTNKLH